MTKNAVSAASVASAASSPAAGVLTRVPTVDGRRLRGETTRTRLLVCARELFGERGFEATSVQAVLDASGVARGALYHHFPSKTVLFEAVLEAVLIEIARVTGSAARGLTDPVTRLRRGSEEWLELALDPSIQRIALLDPQAALGWNRWRELDELHSLAGLRADLRCLVEEGRIPAAQVELHAHMLLAALNEAAIMIARSEDPAAAVDTGREAIGLLLERLAGPATPPA
jgi:AcrR family transcriptional regulator